jgi:hypothetical protein
MEQDKIFNLVKEITKEVKSNYKQIIEILFQPDRHGHIHFDEYLYLTENFNNGNFDENFKRIYTRFWIVGARKFNQELKNEYFQLLSNKELSLYNILTTLKKIPPEYSWLSFSTKLIHSINSNYPIYDSNVAKKLKLKQRNGDVKRDIEIYEELRDRYTHLFNDSGFSEIVEKTRGVLKDKYGDRHKLVSNIKISDSLIWASYIVS